MQAISVLIVEDDVVSARLLNYQLHEAGFQCQIQPNVEDLISTIDNESMPDLFIIDFDLGQSINGLALIKIIKAKTNKPVLMISGTDSEDVIVKCLDAGADQYITKPYRRQELLARVRCTLRKQAYESHVERDMIKIDQCYRELSCAGRTTHITEKEARLLQFLLAHENEELSRDLLCTKIYGEAKSPYSRCLDALIVRVRRKMEIVRAPYRINHVRSVGYAIHNMHTGKIHIKDEFAINSSLRGDAANQESKSP